MSEEDKTVRLVIENVNERDRYVFNIACKGNGEKRGDVISKLMREYAENTYGAEYTAHLAERRKGFDCAARGTRKTEDPNTPQIDGRQLDDTAHLDCE